MIRADPSKTTATFNSKSILTSGLRSTAQLRGGKFSVQCDLPNELGGSDTGMYVFAKWGSFKLWPTLLLVSHFAGPNPVELLLASLGSCQEITWKAYAQATETPLESVSVDLYGDIDLRGFLSVADVSPGLASIHGTVTVKSSAPTEQIKSLKQIVDSRCPILDTLKSIPIDIELKHERL
jgi:uncharacterized OsmC-like protein